MPSKTLAKTSTTSGFAKDHADRLLRNLTVQFERTAKTAGADEVHDLRVAIRRLGAVLKILNDCFPVRETGKIRLALKRIMELAGHVRDRDIAVELLTKVGGPAAAPFVAGHQNRKLQRPPDRPYRYANAAAHRR